MKEPEHNSDFFAHHANGRFTASYKPAPGLKTSHYTAPNFATPQANNAFPLPGAAEQYPPEADETFRSLAADNHRKQFGWEGAGWRVTGIYGYLLKDCQSNLKSRRIFENTASKANT
jgi:hypothetical protein